MPHIAFVTYTAIPDLSADDQLGVAALQQLGARVESVVWDAPNVQWKSFDAIVVRSCWDYHLRPREFRGWIDAVERAGAPVWNPPAMLRWNMEKTYLRDLEARGVPIVPTRWLDRGDARTLRSVLVEEGWSDAVVKPVLSASAFQTWRTSEAGGARDEQRFRALLVRGGVMVQPFLSEVREMGEWSFLFFRGSFSHAVLKRPTGEDFRVQESFGGIARAQRPSAALLAEAKAVVDAVPSPWLYARVDGCVVDGHFQLMELEMLEPSLYLGSDRRAPVRFAQAVLK
jgi:glutathione synthase/RimK-type ligase-like ATP-grasp enzyme